MCQSLTFKKPIMAFTLSGLPSMGNPIFQITLNDLRAVVSELYAQEQQHITKAKAEQMEQATISPREAAKALGVSLTTLWRWHREGYLVPVKVGKKTLYRKSDIDKLLTKAGEGGTR